MGYVRFPVLVSTALVLALAAGCDNTRIVSTPDSGLTCGENERIIDGECRFVCDRDSDCPDGQRCNLFTGECVPKPPGPDGGTPLFLCTEGAVRCRADNKAVETCNEDGVWVTSLTCVGDGFCLNNTCLACQPGVTRCHPENPGAIQVCPSDGSGWQDIVCAGTGTCVQGECRECAPNTTRCSPDGKNVQTCSKTDDPALTWAWKNSGDNFDGTCISQQCIPGSPAMCKPPDCFPGATRCGGDPKFQDVCSATGTWEPRACASQPGMGPDAECQNGVCVDECADAVAQKSYFGCEYWTAIQDNSVEVNYKGGVCSGQGTNDSDFAFVIANRSLSPATVKIYRWYNNAEQLLKTVPVDGKNAPSKGLTVVKVPWQSIGSGSATTGVSVTGKARYAYRIVSSRPVTVYQFSPLDAVLTNQTFTQCYQIPGPFGDGCDSLFAPCIDYGNGTCLSNGYCKYTNVTVNSYSNDASLLLPAHILSSQYVAVSHPHMVFAQSANSQPDGDGNGHITIVATADNTIVRIKSTAKTAAGGGIPALNKGDTTTVNLNRYDVLQIATTNLGNQYIECAPNPFGGLGVACRVNNDLTGSVIESIDSNGQPDPTKPIAVFGGAACAIMPNSAAACDHVEEQIFPFAAWGKQFVAKKSHPVRLTSNTGPFASFAQMSPDYYKVVASCPPSQCPNGTLVTIDPPLSASDVMQPNRCLSGTLQSNTCRLAGGSYMEFHSKSDFVVTADQPIAVAQIFAGQDATSGGAFQGDPSLILLPPVEQWRSEYTVQSAPGLNDNFLAISIDSTRVDSVSVDGVPIPMASFQQVGTTNFFTVNKDVSVGVHTISVTPKSGQVQLPGAGVVVYGYDQYVSYGYTGGLDLGAIVSGIDPGG
ncbi:MAG: IgGFc-binding protein [Myxococcaceae bacterium]|nr:IgGFc-binding protein [Myxococcaceae bacterium]